VIRLAPDGTQFALQGNRAIARRSGVAFAVSMRIRCALGAAALLGIAGCGDGEDHANRDRPAASVNVTAAISDGRIHVSPRSLGAGPIRLIVSNQMTSAQAVTIATGGGASGVTETTAPIRPGGTGALEVDVPEGEHRVSTDDRKVRAAALRVGAPRPSAQNELLQP
jgi:hypothetical protein